MRVQAALGDPSPFRLDRSRRRGIVVVHGFTGTPFEVRLLGESLAARDFSVVGPLLEGHGDGPSALGRSTWADWLGSVERAFDDLSARVERVGICGLSLGGLLSLELGRRRGDSVAAIASLAAPLWLDRWQMRTIRLLGRLPLIAAGSLPKIGGSDIVDEEMRRRNPTGRHFPIRALGSLVDCMQHVQRHLPEVRPPVLVAHGSVDRTAPPACADEIFARVARPIEQITLPRSAHVVTLDVEREELFRRVGDFFERYLERDSN